MQWIVITSPSFFDGEADFITRLFAYGVDTVHLRKPGASAAECARLLDHISAAARSRIVIHDYFELAAPYGLLGIHINARHNEIPEGYTGHISRSCHSFDEVKRYRPECDYVFLSPIFDSVSKQGYRSAFTPEDLSKAAEDGIIDSKVIALGGITPDRVACLRSLGFGGAAMLGCVNNLAALPEASQAAALEQIGKAFKDPQQDCQINLNK